jgi:hypothetical protein
MAAGVLVISVADAAGRSGSASAAWDGAWWLGEALVFGPLAARVLSRSGPGESEAAGLAISVAIATYLIKFLYSPSAFGFPDELEHWHATTDLLATHHLFGVNYLLPVSSVYPGLEAATGALASVTGLPVFAAGLIVAGLAHLLLTAALFVVFRLVGGSPRIAIAACAIYASNPHYQVFDAIFGYQTLALAFFGLALVAALAIVRSGRGSGQLCWWVLAVALLAATVVTHHVTSYALAASLLLLAVFGGIRGLRGAGAKYGSGTLRLALLAGTCLSLIVAWVGLAAASTVSYLTPTLHSFVSGFAGAFTAQAGSAATPAGPLADKLAGYAVAALIMACLPFGWVRIWRTQRDSTWAVALGAGAAAYSVCVLLRITSPDGAELAGRMMTFVYIPVGYTLAVALAGPGRAALGLGDRMDFRLGSRLGRGVRVTLAAAAGGILLAGGLATGWPPYWERLPGRYIVDGFESGITPEGIAAATWSRDFLGTGQRIAADFTNYLLLGSYGAQDPVSGVNEIYCGPRWTAGDAAITREEAVSYLLVDLRMSEHAAVAGYFPGSSAGCPAVIPRSYLTKFDSVSGINRIYDSGNIVIYALAGAQYAP